MATLTVNVVPHSGLRSDNALVAATAGGDACTTGQGVFLMVKNADASSHTVTLSYPSQSFDGQAITARAVAVPAGQTLLIPIHDGYQNTSTGLASWTYDAVTAVTVGAFRVSS